MTDEKFWERLREDAAALRHDPDDVAVGRLSARIRDRVHQPTVAELLVAWLRPLAAGIAAVTTAAIIGLAVYDPPAERETLGGEVIEISMAGDTFHVGQ